MDKKSLTERDICTKFITPAILNAGWDVYMQVLEEVTFKIPPFSEQLRIIKKIDQLMQYCDELKQILRQNQPYGGIVAGGVEGSTGTMILTISDDRRPVMRRHQKTCRNVADLNYLFLN